MKILRIKKTAEFKEISRKNQKFYAKNLILLTAKTSEKYHFDPKTGKNCQEFCRLGFTVSKKVGNAVTRNSVKRKIKEASRKIFPKFAKAHFDYVVIAKFQASDAKFDDFLRDLEFCLKRIHNQKNSVAKD